MIMLKRHHLLFFDKEIFLILKNDLDEVCGYILCAMDLKVYEKNAYPYYLTLKELDEVKAERFPNANRELERFYPEYPAQSNQLLLYHFQDYCPVNTRQILLHHLPENSGNAMLLHTIGLHITA